MLFKSARILLKWAEEADFMGNDPHDLLASPYLSHIANSGLRLVLLQLGRRSPINLRPLLRVPKMENAKGLALFLSGLLQAKESVTAEWASYSNQLGERLVFSAHPNGGWGYPFDWQSRTHFIPHGTPNIVTTSFVGSSLLDLYEENPSEVLRTTIMLAAEYIVRDIPITTDQNGIAFGYAKDDPQIVFNASILGAAFLCRAGRIFSRDLYCERARSAAEFVVRHQRSDGSWIYGLQPTQTWIDSFHTGFVIIALRDLGEELYDGKLLESADRGFEFYRRTFIDSDYAVRYYDKSRYPVDAHAVGQALITLSRFGEQALPERVGAWAITHLQDKRGFFYYQQHRHYTNRIAYMRWSNAWMFRGLCAVIAKEPC